MVPYHILTSIRTPLTARAAFRLGPVGITKSQFLGVTIYVYVSREQPSNTLVTLLYLLGKDRNLQNGNHRP